MSPAPEIVLTAAQSAALVDYRAGLGDLASIEAASLEPQRNERGLDDLLVTPGLHAEARALWQKYDHFVMRGVPPSEDGAIGLIVARAFFEQLKTYRHGRVVKHFTMSPWTTALSHTLADGSFHTDINTADTPPAATVMQLVRPDPDAPRHGQLRVVRVVDLLEALLRQREDRALRLLTEDRVTMVNETSSGSWTGRISDGNEIRFHPETLRAGQRRHGDNPADLEDCLAAIHATALSVAPPVDLGRGEMLFVSNRRALHYRSACTVRFRSFPRDFDSRVVAVLHAVSEPK